MSSPFVSSSGAAGSAVNCKLLLVGRLHKWCIDVRPPFRYVQRCRWLQSGSALAIQIDLNLPAPRVIRVQERVALLRGYPENLFRTLSEVRKMTEQWRSRYNDERPYDSLNDMTPVEYLQTNNRPETLL